jgi:ketosteroid isomerase-like protein
MKKMILAAYALLLCMFISCNDAAKNESSNSQAEKNKENILTVYKGIESGDMSKMDEFVAADVVDHTDRGDIKGLDSAKKMLGDLHNHFSNLKMEMLAEGTSSSGEYHFTLVRMTGTTKDAAMGMPANTAIDQTSVDVVRMVNGKAAEHWGYVNPKDVMKMMSMNKPPEVVMDKMENKMMDQKDTTMKK